MSTTNNTVNNQTGSSANSVFHSHIRAASGKWHNYNDQTDQHGYYSGVGSPEGVVAADIGSYYSDTGVSAAGIYYKTTDTVNTGWVLAAPSSGGGGGFTSIVSQVFTANGTYTPTVGMQYCIIEVLGGGGAGRGVTTVQRGGGGGGSAEYAKGVFSAAAIGVSQAVTIGAAGAGVVNGAGGNGGTTSVGALITAFGGLGGSNAPLGGATLGGTGGTGGAGGNVRAKGQAGGVGSSDAGNCYSGFGGNSQYGGGGNAVVTVTPGAGQPGGGHGAGGSGACGNTGGNLAGGNGSSGIVIITEYV